MTISSSRRVIKQAGGANACVIEPFVPPVEVNLHILKEEKKPVFPRYAPDGQPVDVLFDLEAEQSGQGLEIPEEDLINVQETLAESSREAEHILEEARAKADEILAGAIEQARKEYEAAREAGYGAGYESGYQEGLSKALEAGQKELEEQLKAFDQDIRKALKSVEKAKERCVHEYLEELKECAIAIGEKVIRISLRSSGEVIKQMIVSATEKLKKTTWVKIYINKCDYELMMEADADLVDELSHLSDNIKFIVMDKEDSGNCIIEMPEEIVDVSVNTQIENIKDILENVRV